MLPDALYPHPSIQTTRRHLRVSHLRGDSCAGCGNAMHFGTVTGIQYCPGRCKADARPRLWQRHGVLYRGEQVVVATDELAREYGFSSVGQMRRYLS